MAPKKLAKYTLIVFEDNSETLKSIDIVPSSWIHRDSDNNLFTPFFETFSLENQKILLDLVKNCKPPISTWKPYRIQVRGSAENYSDAQKKLRILETEAYAFSTDSEEHAVEKQKSLSKQFRVRPNKSTNEKNDDEFISDLNGPFDRSKFNMLIENDDESSQCSNNNQAKRQSKSSSSQKSKKFKSTTAGNSSDEEILRSNRRTLSTDSTEDESSSDDDCDLSPFNRTITNKTSAKIDDRSINLNNTEPLQLTPKSGRHIIPRLVDTPTAASVSGFISKISASKDNLGSKKYDDNDVFLLLIEVYRKLSAQIGTLQRDNRDIKGMISSLSDAQIPSTSHYIPLEEHKDLKIPFETKESFESFDLKLETDANFRKVTIERVLHILDIKIKDPIKKNISAIIKKFMGPDVYEKYTAQKKMENKDIFKDTNFSKIIFEALDNDIKRFNDKNANSEIRIPSLKENDYLTALGKVFNLSREWNGQRNERGKKDTNKTPGKNSQGL